MSNQNATYFNMDNVVAGYAGRVVLHDISMNIAVGEIAAIIGGNGAGKTTLLRTISRMIQTSSGSMSFAGLNLLSYPGDKLPSLGIAHVPEGRRVFSKLSVIENLELGAFSVTDRHLIDERIQNAFSFFPILAERRHQLAGLLSGGEQQMLALSRALMCGPKLLLLDEPSMGVAPKIVEKIFTTLDELNKGGMTILIVEQNANVALELCNHAYVLTLGKITLQGTGTELLGNPEVKNMYLGLA